jgi:hypothetical protein
MCECPKALWPQPALSEDVTGEGHHPCSHAPWLEAFRANLVPSSVGWGNVEGLSKHNGSVGRCCRCYPPFIWCGSIWGHNYELVAPPDHDMFVDIVTRFFSVISSLKTDLFTIWFLGIFLCIFGFIFQEKGMPQSSLPTFALLSW